MLKIQYYPTFYNSGFTPLEVSGWDYVANVIANPRLTYFNKKDIPLWTFYVPVNDDIIEWDNESKMRRGSSNNMRQIHAVQIDMDKGSPTIDEFIEKYSDYEFYLYTTFSYTKELQKFRAIFPLDGIYGNNLFTVSDNNKIITRLFPGCDHTSVTSFHRHFIPACNPRGGDYVYHINKGNTRLSLPWEEMLKNYNDANAPDISIEYDQGDQLDDWYYEIDGLYVPKVIDIKEATRKNCEKLLSDIPWGTKGTGVVHYTMTHCYGKLVKSGHAPTEAAEFIASFAGKDRKAEALALAKMK